MENNIIGTSFFQVTAVDTDVNQNALLTYSIAHTYIQGELATSFVQINSENGIIYSQRSFDYEELKKFQIQIQVRYSGVPQLSTKVSVDVVMVDQNDNAPVIVHPVSVFGSTVTETVPRFAEPGYMVAKVSATDADSGQNVYLSYEIRQGTVPDLFTISAYTGDIWTTRRIEKQDANSQRLLILVKDSGTSSLTVTMTIALSVVGRETELNSGTSNHSENRDISSDFSLYLVISLGIISSIFFMVLIILAFKVQRQRLRFADTGCYIEICCCFEARSSLNGIQKASRNIHIAPNYVDVFGGDPLSQRFRYEACSTLNSSKATVLVPKLRTGENYMDSEAMEIEKSILNAKYSNKSSTVNDEVRQ
ncbi:protocadherin gamma-A6-like [Leucoraja erinacea]|uniref:protocadherin gamma-A6-like n=1 Tax=Leucoraja erinaceus TaxID=7782 RepID=UPI002458B401|nr:protocadherin gamma-A6-like [Leucoraja erinacea]